MEAIAAIAADQRAALVDDTATQLVAACQDELLLTEACLVALEPVWCFTYRRSTPPAALVRRSEHGHGPGANGQSVQRGGVRSAGKGLGGQPC